MKQLYVNGTVYTGQSCFAQAFSVEDEKFVAVGSNEDILRSAKPEDKVRDLGGQFVCPGFNDSHMHLLMVGESLQAVDLNSHTSSLQDMLGAIREFIAGKKPEPGVWVQGQGWNQDYFQGEKCFPDRWDLDTVCTKNPLCMVRTCTHIVVVNSKALEVIGITRDTPDPDGGRIVHDENGEPTGVLCETARYLALDAIPVPGKEGIKTELEDAMRLINHWGVTSVQTDDFTTYRGVPYDVVIEAFTELVKEGRATVRVNQQSHFTNLADLEGFIQKGYRTGWGDDMFKIGPLKMLGDGSLGARTAYMRRPYHDDPSTRGVPVYTRELFRSMISYANVHGMQIAIHCIGDGILDEVLDAYESAFAEHPREDHRDGIVHLEITNPDQMERMKRLHLHAYIQSIFLDYDIHIVEDRVGPEVAATSFNMKSLYTIGDRPSNGTDSPVEPANAMRCIQCAVTRCTLKDHVGPYRPEEALTVAEALDSYTCNGAYASFDENKKGKIKAGMLADFVILTTDPFKTDPFALQDIQVLETYLNGKIVYKNLRSSAGNK